MRTYNSWTESELRSEITRIGAMIDAAVGVRDERKRCAVSYLRQLLRDRHDSLSILRQTKLH